MPERISNKSGPSACARPRSVPSSRPLDREPGLSAATSGVLESRCPRPCRFGSERRPECGKVQNPAGRRNGSNDARYQGKRRLDRRVVSVLSLVLRFYEASAEQRCVGSVVRPLEDLGYWPTAPTRGDRMNSETNSDERALSRPWRLRPNQSWDRPLRGYTVPRAERDWARSAS